MDAGTWIGIGIATVIAYFLVRAWFRPVPKPTEPEPDPDSQYSPAGAQIVRSLEQARREWTGR